MSAPTKLPDIVTKTAEVLLSGFLANWALYGVLVLQVYLYTVAFPKDRLPLKITVYTTFLLETAQTGLITHDAFKFFAFGFTDPLLLDEVSTGWFSIPVLTGIIACVAQGFYGYRIGIITQSKYPVGVIAFFSLVQLGGAIGIGIQTKNAQFFSRVFLKEGSFITTGVWEAGSAACDLLIAGIMTYHLRKRDTGFQYTHDIVTRVIRLTIETGTLTATLAIAVLVLAYLPGHPPYYQACALILGKAYSNSMMVALNSRMKVISNSSTASWNESSIPPLPSKSLTYGEVMFLKPLDEIESGTTDVSRSQNELTTFDVIVDGNGASYTGNKRSGELDS
ncbi:hypothetical protein BJ912DRAFT_1062186 [Pholiota molesta]|nr:hypothetical protein BJ912DRAFT_1062186 [Pholiota molesta]